MDWSDNRSIDEMKFGAAWKPTLGDIMPDHPWDVSLFTYAPPPVEQRQPDFDPVADEAATLARWKKRMSEIPTDAAIAAWKATHRIDLDRVRRLLTECGVKTADDLRVLGCTGCVAHGLTIDDIKFLRIGLAGSGVGLPCFVPKTRYCLAHEVTGGLQDGQAQQHGGYVDTISRPLTPQESSHGQLVHEAQWADGERKAHETLVGRKLPEGWAPGLDAIPPPGTDRAEAARLGNYFDTHEVTEQNSVAIQPWTCPEHKKTLWGCRYCVAQAIVEGDLEPSFVLGVTSPPDLTTDPPTPGGFSITDECVGGRAGMEIADEDAAGVDSVKLYVRVATYSRKLSRD
jgi:hypothetical protein